VGARRLLLQFGAHWTSGHAIGSRSVVGNPAMRAGIQPNRETTLRPKKSAHYTRRNPTIRRRFAR
jgi:hypothetical protein